MPLETLKKVFGYDSFRPGQAEIVEHIISGGNALVLMPTGGGKSLCYQIPSLIREGVGIVISPLISLMQDQVVTLEQLGVRAAFLNSTLSASESTQIKRDLAEGELDLIYVAPERLMMPETLQFFAGLKVSLIAIDEAHCVSQWGHDFRPSYMDLAHLPKVFKEVPRVALTATADPATKNEIITKLGLEEAEQFVSSFDRPNISYSIDLKSSGFKQLVDFINSSETDSSGIVYCLSRKKVEDVCDKLTDKGFSALPYHAGLSAAERERNQRRFILEEGWIIVATVAFGMGIDKPNVRFVAHMDLPSSIESYYQETGRAGRDGLPAKAWMCYGLADLSMRRQMISSSDSNEKRKLVEQSKLNALIGLSETVKCRRQVLLSYFGEEREEKCMNCDTCQNPVDTWDGKIAAQKALSAAYRTEQRFGAAYLCNILLGNADQRIKSFRHDQLKTFGVGKDLNKTEWTSVFRQLVAMGALEVDVDGYGGMSLTELGFSILKGEKEIQFRKDILKKKSKSKTKPDETPIAEADQALFDLLREKRLSLAKSANLPPYVIFHDKTLKELASKKPNSLNEMANISGIGESKLKKYGEDFLSLIIEADKKDRELLF